MTKQRLFKGFDGIKIRKEGIEFDHISHENLIDSGTIIKGEKKYYLINENQYLNVFYNSSIRTLTIEGNPLYYYQGHNFFGDLETYQKAIMKIAKDLEIDLLDAQVEYFEFGIIVTTQHNSKPIIAAHEEINGFKKSEETKNGYLAYFEGKYLDVKIYDASRNLKAKQNRSERANIERLGWSKAGNYIKYELVYKKPVALRMKHNITLRELLQMDFYQKVRRHIISIYRKIKVQKNIEFRLQIKPSSLDIFVLVSLSTYLKAGGNINDFENYIMNQINILPDQTLSKSDKAQRRLQVKKTIDNNFIFIDDEFNLIRLLEHRLKSHP